jgi:DNA-binding transcriptional MocR family regulator
MPKSARKEVARIAAELDVPVIDDGTLADLAFEAMPPPGIAVHAPEAAVLTLGSLSKLLWPGLRVGWVRAPEPIIERLARVRSAVDLGSPLVTQAIAVRLLGAISDARRLRREQLKPRRDLLAQLLRDHLPDWSFQVPSGGLFLWVRLPCGDAREFAQVTLRHGAVILPGPTMSPAEQHAAYVRLPFLAEPEVLETGIRRLRAAWREYQSSDRRERRQSLTLV